MTTETIDHVIEGGGPPTDAPPSRGAHYINITTGEQYLAKGIDSVDDWVLQEKGMSKAEADQAYQPRGNYATTQQLADGLADKVSVAQGMGLSSNDFTTGEKQKLAGLEGSHFRGTFLSLSALQAGATDPMPGDYADVDAGEGESVARYIWDDSDSEWVAQGGSAGPLTAAQIKTLYESNPDTNAFTDAEKQKLSDLTPGGGGGDDTIIENFRNNSYEALFSRPETPPARVGQKCIQLDDNGTTCEWVVFLDYDGTTLSWARMAVPIRAWGLNTPLVFTIALTAEMRAYALIADQFTLEGKQSTLRLPSLVPDTEQYWGDEILPHDGMPISLFNGSEYPWTVILDPQVFWQSGYTIAEVEAYGFDALGVTVGQQGTDNREVVLTIPPKTTFWIDLTVWRTGTDVSYYLNANQLFIPNVP